MSEAISKAGHRRKREARQIDETVKLIRQCVEDGQQLQVDVVPSIVEREFRVPLHVFWLAVNRLRHHMRVVIEGGGYYRQASQAHDYMADKVSFGSPGGEVLRFDYPHHFFGRNGGRKRKCAEWLASEAAQ